MYPFAERGMKKSHIQNVGVIRLLLLFTHSYMICVWFGED